MNFSYGGEPSLAWTGAGHGVAWVGDRLYASLVDADGASSGDPIPIDEASLLVSLVWAPPGFAATWTSLRDGSPQVYFATVAP